MKVDLSNYLCYNSRVRLIPYSLLNNVVVGNGNPMENIQHLLDEAERRGFRPTGKPYLDIKGQGGWCVNGTADFKKIKGGSSWSHTGWVFDNEADANNFYRLTKISAKTLNYSPDKNKEALDSFFAKNI